MAVTRDGRSESDEFPALWKTLGPAHKGLSEAVGVINQGLMLQ
jgi:hypothetical protein